MYMNIIIQINIIFFPNILKTSNNCYIQFNCFIIIQINFPPNIEKHQKKIFTL